VRQFDPGKIPQLGGDVELEPDDKSEAKQTVRVRKTYGVAEIMGVTDENGQNGVVAFHPDGSWWWIRKIDPRDPWSKDPDSWKRQADG
jgi:hypothetical protein